MPRKLSRKLLLGSLLALAACGAARVIHQDQTGGVIELQGDQAHAMDDATHQMAAHCGAKNFTVVSQGEEPIGTDPITQQNRATDSTTSPNGRTASTDATATTPQSPRTATAWRVHYQCAGAGAPPPAQPPPPAPPAY
jgi:hypothetical protein